MIETSVEAGDYLDNAYPIGEEVFATRIIDPCLTPDKVDMSRLAGYDTCPECREEVRYVMKHKGFYCCSCWLLYENVYVGALDREGNFIPVGGFE